LALPEVFEVPEIPETDAAATDVADSARDAWSRTLDELEASLGAEAADHGVSYDTGTWTPPGDLGPIPAELEARARQLLSGQRELIAELDHTRRATAAQLIALRKMPATRPTGASVYLDTNG
jgi:hypothetical protein